MTMQGGERRQRRDARPGWVPIRWPLDMPVMVEEGGSCALDVRMVDLSVRGCRLHAGFRLIERRTVRLRVEGLSPLRGRTAWSRDGYAGIDFDHDLHPSVVRHLVNRFSGRAPAIPHD